ncbi:putative transcriptional regulator YdeE [Mucilaginibacter frigoritolerans]|jgi:predicted transcriptional regulator YdeE|uniref:Putative transcriptional regulator YdeE n=1 Tax=Mucilaginibacter frigoritolerans TaxID=652788 RepID=A0A562TT43_9SPHI|nr:GyrI-like domain-containing protein [Mucilaginibacter frigoritolerans]TWI96761.1 putative transcriptional regulator YdeE [Mucilaginibacter frigoritolerans]
MITKIELTNLTGFYVTGIAVRTTNQNNQSQKDIGDLWARFMADDVMSQINSRISDDIYSVYTDYETDHTGFYTTILGCKVVATDHIPEGFASIFIPADNYHVYYLEGKFPNKIGEAWQHIWQNANNRKYTADFDLYTFDAESFEETEAKIYLAVN